MITGKKLLQVVPFAVIGVVCLVLAAPSISQEKDPGFKNVQVLKDLTREQLEDYMSNIVEYLGVEKCTFCHVRDKSSDEKEHKVKARKYMQLVKDFNEKYFKDEEEKITCYTCHRGEKEVVNKPKE